MRSAYRPQFAATPVRCPECDQLVAIERGKFIQHWPTKTPTGAPCRMTLKKPQTADQKAQARTEALRLADRAIARDDESIYDVASSVGQIVDNVKRMHWFREAVADWLRPDTAAARR